MYIVQSIIPRKNSQTKIQLKEMNKMPNIFMTFISMISVCNLLTSILYCIIVS